MTDFEIDNTIEWKEWLREFRLYDEYLTER